MKEEYRYSLIQRIYSALPSGVREYRQMKIISGYLLDRRFVTDALFRSELYVCLGLADLFCSI